MLASVWEISCDTTEKMRHPTTQNGSFSARNKGWITDAARIILQCVSLLLLVKFPTSLAYIKNTAKSMRMYVLDRVTTICGVTDPKKRNYMTSKENPADITSHGSTVNEPPKSSWFKEPEVLQRTARMVFKNPTA